MISVILYGRNDSYGYNLHKRAVLSLNSIASVLTDRDEIIFVDYNSPAGFPTFIHAIHDNLDAKTKDLLRVIRVPGSFHAKRYGSKTHLAALEPIARNIGIRRSNPLNKFVLSTNTDILLLLKVGGALSSLVAGFEEQTHWFSSPRFEIPEGIWENFDRTKTKQTKGKLESLVETLSLETVVYSSWWNKYDAPGDFQMVSRELLFECHAFDESMLLGWHCDSNLNKRLYEQGYHNQSLYPVVRAFHCDHTRQTTAMHAHRSLQNSEKKYIDFAHEFVVNDRNWGAKDEVFAEYSGNECDGTVELNASVYALRKYKSNPEALIYRREYYEKTFFNKGATLAFFYDSIAMGPKNQKIGWIGPSEGMTDSIADFLDRLNFFHPVKLLDENDTPMDLDVIVVNFSDELFPMSQKLVLWDEFQEILIRLSNEMDAEELSAKIRFYFFNANHTRFEDWIKRQFYIAKTPISTKLLQGNLSLEAINIIKLTKLVSCKFFVELQNDAKEKGKGYYYLSNQAWNYSLFINLKQSILDIEGLDLSGSAIVRVKIEKQMSYEVSVLPMGEGGDVCGDEQFVTQSGVSVLEFTIDHIAELSGFFVRPGQVSPENNEIKINDIAILQKPIAVDWEVLPAVGNEVNQNAVIYKLRRLIVTRRYSHPKLYNLCKVIYRKMVS